MQRFYYLSVASQQDGSAPDAAACLSQQAHLAMSPADLAKEISQGGDELSEDGCRGVLDTWQAEGRLNVTSYPGRAGELTVRVDARGVTEKSVARAYCRLLIRKMHALEAEVCFTVG